MEVEWGKVFLSMFCFLFIILRLSLEPLNRPGRSCGLPEKDDSRPEGEGVPLRPYPGATPGRLGGAGYPHPPPGTAGPRRERLM